MFKDILGARHALEAWFVKPTASADGRVCNHAGRVRPGRYNSSFAL